MPERERVYFVRRDGRPGCFHLCLTPAQLAVYRRCVDYQVASEEEYHAARARLEQKEEQTASQ